MPVASGSPKASCIPNGKRRHRRHSSGKTEFNIIDVRKMNGRDPFETHLTHPSFKLLSFPRNTVGKQFL
jgi:hypothetical protein